MCARLTRAVDVVKPATVRDGGGLAESDPELPFSHPLAQAVVVGTLSTKLDHVIRLIQTADPRDSFIVLSANSTSRLSMAEALSVTSIPFATFLQPRDMQGSSSVYRAKELRRFAEDPRVRVLVMDLDLAAKGLDILVRAFSADLTLTR